MPHASLTPADGPEKRSLQKLWVPVVVLAGVALGELVSFASTSSEEYGPPPGAFGYFPHFRPDPLLQLHVVLTTVEVALLASLVAIYVRMYAQTNANFSLGLVVVLFALLVEALLSYPLVIGYYGSISLESDLSPPADVLTVCAYAVFLYLSLE